MMLLKSEENVFKRFSSSKGINKRKQQLDIYANGFYFNLILWVSDWNEIDLEI